MGRDRMCRVSCRGHLDSGSADARIEGRREKSPARYAMRDAARMHHAADGNSVASLIRQPDAANPYAMSGGGQPRSCPSFYSKAISRSSMQHYSIQNTAYRIQHTQREIGRDLERWTDKVR